MEKYKIKIFYISVGRSDYGIIRNGIIQLQKNPKVLCYPVIIGAHHHKKFGNTKSEIIKDKLKNSIFLKLKYLNNKKNNTNFYIEQILNKLNKITNKYKPNICIITGDRYEMLGASLVCLNRNIPIIHFCGGSITVGSLDDSYRNIISNISELHFVETEKHKKQLLKKGVNKKKIYISGAPALENIKKIKFLKKDVLFKKYKLNYKKKTIIFTFHPETNIDIKKNLSNLEISINFLQRLNPEDYNIVITYPNADFGFEEIINFYKKIKNDNIFILKNLGSENYFNLLKYAFVMIGNSSSGIIESGSFNLPVLNLGDRQKGRFRDVNVLDCKFSHDEINKKFKLITKKTFKNKMSKMRNIYSLKYNSAKFCEKIIKYFYPK